MGRRERRRRRGMEEDGEGRRGGEVREEGRGGEGGVS